MAWRNIQRNPRRNILTILVILAIAFALFSSNLRTSGGFITGIDPEKEAKISSGPQTIRKGRYLDPSDTNTAVAGSLLAKKLKVDIGEELVVLGSAMDASIAATVLKVTGIFSSGMDEYTIVPPFRSLCLISRRLFPWEPQCMKSLSFVTACGMWGG
nr:hypothetical protein [uncultured Desulfobacter sp.]